MPHERIVRLATPLVEWHDLRLLEAAPDWSPPYRAPAARLLVPRSDWIECDLDGRRHVCDRLDGLWLTPAAPYRMRQPWRGQRSVVLVLHDAAVPGRPAAMPARLPAQAAWWLARWQARLQSAPMQALAFEESVAGFVQQVLAAASAAPAWPALPHRAVERAREFLNAEPGSAHTLAQIAAAARCSAFHLARGFRRHTGLSLHGYRTRLRMAIAVQRLAEGERDLTALALDLGYSSHSHFSAVFRRQFGCAPREVRRNLTAAMPA